MNLKLAIVFGVLGFIFSCRTWLSFLDTLSPLSGLCVYYVIVFATLMVLEAQGLIVAGVKLSTSVQGIGFLLIYYAFFIIFNYQSCWINHVTGRECDEHNISNVYLQAEDGSIYFLLHKYIKNHEICRILTFVVAPFILVLMGTYLTSEKITLGIV